MDINIFKEFMWKCSDEKAVVHIRIWPPDPPMKAFDVVLLADKPIFPGDSTWHVVCQAMSRKEANETIGKIRSWFPAASKCVHVLSDD